MMIAKNTNLYFTFFLFLCLVPIPAGAQESGVEYSEEFKVARNALNQEQWKKGWKLITELQLAEPKSSHVHATAGRMKLAMGHFVAGRQDIKKAMKIDPTDPIALLGMAEVLKIEGDFEACSEMATQAYFKNTEFHLFEPIIQLKCEMHLINLEYGEAEKIIQATINTELHTVALINDLAYLYQKQGQEAKALDILYDCMEAFGEDVTTLNNTGYVLNLLGKYESALVHLEKAKKIEPKNPYILSNISIAYYLNGDSENARKYMYKSLDYDGSECPVANYIKARLLADAGSCDEACNLCTESSKIDHDKFGNPQLFSLDETHCDCNLTEGR